jgi:phosphatidylglycerol:prolipoprotein diacylglycerol transferase
MTIYPLKFVLGPLTITGYGIMMMVAFLMAGWAIQVDLRRRNMNEDYAADIVFAAVIGGIVGAKIWYVLLTGTWDALLSRGGFVWYGGFLGGVAGVLLSGWRRRIPARWTMELTAAPLALGYALGRVGCSLTTTMASRQAFPGP